MVLLLRMKIMMLVTIMGSRMVMTEVTVEYDIVTETAVQYPGFLVTTRRRRRKQEEDVEVWRRWCR